MNLPNKLTVFRVILIPFFVCFMLADIFGGIDKYIAVGIFIVASLTDLLDGKIARKYNLVTNFGKFMDPLADKLLVAAALISMVELEDIAAWIVIVIISREFIITGFRLIAVETGVVIAASMWGKAKTVSQMIMIIIVLSGAFQGNIIEQILIYVSAVLTIISGVDYIVKNINVLKG